MLKITFNGKFLSSPSTGVHRVAVELIAALDALITEGDQFDQEFVADLVTPAGASIDREIREITEKSGGFLSGFLKNIPWEQITLPVLARNTLLLNLCNLGPVFHGNSATMIHDAQVHITPRSYGIGFRTWYKFVQPLLGKRCRMIFTVSEYSKVQLVKYKVAPEEKIKVLYNGCDHIKRIVADEKFVSENGLRGVRYFLALASTQSHKNIRILLEAFRSAELQDVVLVLFGTATKADFEARGEVVPDNVRPIGRVSDEQLAALFQAAAGFACPSTTEGFGLPPLEAMTMGCPAIVAPCGALPEVCGEAALYANPLQSSEWADAIRKLIDDPDFARSLRKKGLEQSAKFTWRQSALQLMHHVAPYLSKKSALEKRLRMTQVL